MSGSYLLKTLFAIHSLKNALVNTWLDQGYPKKYVFTTFEKIKLYSGEINTGWAKVISEFYL